MKRAPTLKSAALLSAALITTLAAISLPSRAQLSPAADRSASSAAQGLEDNADLQRLRDADQAARSPGRDNIDWSIVAKQDQERRVEVLALLKAGKARTSADYYNAAMVYQHGDGVEDIRQAHALASIATLLQPDHKPALWLRAASWDRLLMRLNKPQWYGTQFTKPEGSELWELYKVDESAVTDADRAALGVRPLAAAKAQVERMNSKR